MYETLQRELRNIVKELAGQEVAFSLQAPESIEHGDYSTNAALVLAKPLNKNPRGIAEQIKGYFELRISDLEFLDRVELAGPGFVNFFVSKNALFDTVNTILEQKDNFGSSKRLKGKKVITEFTDPNPFKEFHIGHLYSNSVGEAISRLVESQGAEVRRVNYQGDVGLHVAKSVWGMLHRRQETGLTLEEVGKWSLQEKARFLGQAYALGATAYEEDEQAKQEIIDLNKKIFAKDAQIMSIYEKGKEWSLAYFEELYKRLGTKFDRLFFESEVGEDGRKLVLGYLEKGVFEESDGAVIFPGEKYGLHNRVFINSLGLPTYEAKELGLAPAKYEYFPYDVSIIITGNEINEYFKVLLKALEQIRPDLAEKTVHIGHGMVRLPEGKMSSRTGKVITGEWLLDEAKRRSAEKIETSIRSGVHSFKAENLSDVASDSNIQLSHSEESLSLGRSELTEEEKDRISEKVGVGAVKYALLKSGIGGNIAFSFDESISFEGNAGPYLQYTYVRTKSVLSKVKSEKLKVNNLLEDTDKSQNELVEGKWTHSTNSGQELEIEEVALLRHLLHFPEVVAHAASTYSPNIVAEYLYQLAQKFNLFYAKHKIVGSEQEEFRLALTTAVGQTLKNGLHILGIPVVEKM